jgi:hypothetical protein
LDFASKLIAKFGIIWIDVLQVDDFVAVDKGSNRQLSRVCLSDSLFGWTATACSLRALAPG